VKKWHKKQYKNVKSGKDWKKERRKKNLSPLAYDKINCRFSFVF
jgi:hypothetical protein